ncbi:unnamed protein product [Spodoptera exigua]|uniref:Regulatory protein zeste n=1 Tax=Spodoptera exigua TaxID=7107 RepID=A0A835GRZ6_SPOEX|nr:hypothetical protein HW555_002046 [Spodoptera exigua]KAH9629267.1 hypothetical protein HF086_008349 [Spodoptera exigua]CAH0701557.1 unnamed protein product [Spodoptera exigua]
MARARPGMCNIRRRVSVEQLRVLFESVEEDPTLYNSGRADMSFATVQKWTKLSEVLNNIPDGAALTAMNWKYVLRYWGENTKRRMKLGKTNYMKSKRAAFLSHGELEVLHDLEKKLYEFMKQEEAKEAINLNERVFDMDAYENRPRRSLRISNRTFVPDEDDETNMAMQINYETAKTLHERQLDFIANDTSEDLAGAPQQQILARQLDRLQTVSRELEDHIATVQNRIHLIKDMWMHNCGQRH